MSSLAQPPRPSLPLRMCESCKKLSEPMAGVTFGTRYACGKCARRLAQ